MRAVILAGGRGRRLAPYTTVLPKPLVPIGDRPVLGLIIHQLAQAGFTRIDLCVGHLGQLIRAYFAEGIGVPDGVELGYHWEEEPLGTAGALRNISGLSSTFLVMNGDIVTSLNYADLVRFHRDAGAALTIATYHKTVKMELGVIEGETNTVTGYIEKPTIPFRVSMGIYVYEPVVLEHIPPRQFDFPDVVHALLDADLPIAAYPFDGRWFDIGTMDDHARVLAELEADPHALDG